MQSQLQALFSSCLRVLDSLTLSTLEEDTPLIVNFKRQDCESQYKTQRETSSGGDRVLMKITVCFRVFVKRKTNLCRPWPRVTLAWAIK